METQLPTTKIDPATELFSTVFTKQDFLLFYKEVDQIMTQMFTGSGNFEETVKSILSPEKNNSILEFLKQESVKMENPVDIKVALSKIQKLGDGLPIISLALAIEPTTSVIKNISFWFTKRLDRKVILDFKLERNFIGGAYISYNGLYKDYTLQTKIDTYFEKQSTALPHHG